MGELEDFNGGMEALERGFRRQESERACLPRVSKARARMVLGRDANSAFFATLALKRGLAVDWGTPTLATDGKTIYFNPDYVAGLDDEQLLGVVAHEVYHVANKHHTRMGDRDLSLWQVACDLAINPTLLECGLKLPPGALLPGAGEFKDIPTGLSAEENYRRLLKPRPPHGQGQQPPPGGGDGEAPGDGEAGGERGQGEGGGGDATPDPGMCGAVRRPPQATPVDIQQAEAEAEADLCQAFQAAKRKGSLAAGLERGVTETIYPKPDCWEVLAEFVMTKVRETLTWNKPNRRHVWQDVYLPSKGGESLGHIVLAFDQSGSIGQRESSVFWGGILNLIDRWPCKLTILYHDVNVAGEQTWDPADGDELRLEPKGGGGTSHRDVFRRVAELHEEEEVACVICLTDLFTDFPEDEPQVPVLWAVLGGPPANDARFAPPFGERVDMVLRDDQ